MYLWNIIYWPTYQVYYIGIITIFSNIKYFLKNKNFIYPYKVKKKTIFQYGYIIYLIFIKLPEIFFKIALTILG